MIILQKHDLGFIPNRIPPKFVLFCIKIVTGISLRNGENFCHRFSPNNGRPLYKIIPNFQTTRYALWNAPLNFNYIILFTAILLFFCMALLFVIIFRIYFGREFHPQNTQCKVLLCGFADGYL